MSHVPIHRCKTSFVSPVLDSETLSQCVQKAVAEADWNFMGPMGIPFPKSERNVTFLGILTYCYALGIYPICDIVQRLVQEKGGHTLAMMGINRQSLCRFRRAFRPLLAQCLAAVLQASGAANSDRWTNHDSEYFADEAERRIALACDWDGEPRL